MFVPIVANVFGVAGASARFSFLCGSRERAEDFRLIVGQMSYEDFGVSGFRQRNGSATSATDFCDERPRRGFGDTMSRRRTIAPGAFPQAAQRSRYRSTCARLLVTADVAVRSIIQRAPWRPLQVRQYRA